MRKGQPQKLIDTVAWVRIDDAGRILCVRPRDKQVFFIPGGKREGAETDQQTLLREINEELGVTVDVTTAVHVGTYTAPTHDGSDSWVAMACYTAAYSGAVAACSEIEEITWFRYLDRARVPPVDQLLFDDLAAAGHLR